MGHISAAQFLVAYALAAGAGTAVFFHASRHHYRHPSLWASAVFLFLGVALPVYIVVHRQRRSRPQP
jgi:hypothetical protein